MKKPKTLFFNLKEPMRPANVAGYWPETRREKKEMEEIAEKSIDRPTAKPPLRKV